MGLALELIKQFDRIAAEHEKQRERRINEFKIYSLKPLKRRLKEKELKEMRK
jgi:hypothetical protein